MITSAATSPSKVILETPALQDVRVAGGISIRSEVRDGKSCVTRLRERDGYKARLVRRTNPPEAIVINTGGGLAGGDRILQSCEIGKGAALTITTQAAERCYRSNDTATTSIAVEASLSEEATLNWLPQETILFDNARIARSIDVTLAPTARILMAETVVFGRRAMGETLTGGLFADRWRVRRGSRLIFAENVRLSGDVFRVMSQPAISQGAHAALTLVLAAPDAENWLGSARSVLADAPIECAASAWDDKLVVRGLADKPEDVRQLMQALIPAIGGPTLPRSWST